MNSLSGPCRKVSPSWPTSEDTVKADGAEADGALRHCPWAAHSSGLSLSSADPATGGRLYPQRAGTADYVRTMVTVQTSESPKFCCILPCLVSETKNRMGKDK